jgi:hypothetical protein
MQLTLQYASCDHAIVLKYAVLQYLHAAFNVIWLMLRPLYNDSISCDITHHEANCC